MLFSPRRNNRNPHSLEIEKRKDRKGFHRYSIWHIRMTLITFGVKQAEAGGGERKEREVERGERRGQGREGVRESVNVCSKTLEIRVSNRSS